MESKSSRLVRTFSASDDWSDQHEYTVQLMPAREALALAPEVAIVFGDALGKMISAIGGSAKPADRSKPAEDEDDDKAAAADPFASADFGGDLPADPADLRIGDASESEEDFFASMAYGGFDRLLDGELNGDKIGEAVTSLAREFTAAGSFKLAMKLTRHVYRDGKKLDTAIAFDSAFTGNLGELFYVLFVVLRENYASVARGLAAPLAGARRR